MSGRTRVSPGLAPPRVRLTARTDVGRLFGCLSSALASHEWWATGNESGGGRSAPIYMPRAPKKRLNTRRPYETYRPPWCTLLSASTKIGQSQADVRFVLLARRRSAIRDRAVKRQTLHISRISWTAR